MHIAAFNPIVYSYFEKGCQKNSARENHER